MGSGQRRADFGQFNRMEYLRSAHNVLGRRWQRDERMATQLKQFESRACNCKDRFWEQPATIDALDEAVSL
jgi:hypothetical protein